MAIAIIGLSILFFLGHALDWFFEKTKIPDLLILVALGYLLGPIFQLIQVSDLGKVGGFFSTTALIVILYQGGLQINARDLVKSSLPALSLTALGFSLTALFGFLISLPFFGWQMALLFGVGIGSTSSAIVIPMVKNLSVSSKTKNVLSLESAFTDVLTIVIFLVCLEAILDNSFEFEKILIGIGPKTVLSIVLGAMLTVIWAALKKHFNHILKMSFAGEAWALFSYGIIEVSGYNGAMGVLSLGFCLKNLNLLAPLPSVNRALNITPVNFKDLALLEEISLILKTFFFIYLGLIINFSDTWLVLLAAATSLSIFLIRYVAVHLVLQKNKFSRLEAMITTAMGPRGLACAVLATLPLQKGLTGGDPLQNTFFSLIPITIFITALLSILFENKSLRKKFYFLFSSFKEELPQLNLKNKKTSQ